VCGRTDSGAIQLIHARDGNVAMFHSAANVSLYIFYFQLFRISRPPDDSGEVLCFTAYLVCVTTIDLRNTERSCMAYP